MWHLVNQWISVILLICSKVFRSEFHSKCKRVNSPKKWKLSFTHPHVILVWLSLLWGTQKKIFLESVGNPTILVVPVYAHENFENRTKYIFIRVSKWWQNLFILSWIVSLLRMNCTHWYCCSFVWAFCFFNSKQKHQIYKATSKLSNGVKIT